MLLEMRPRLLLLRRTEKNENSQNSVTKAPVISPPGLFLPKLISNRKSMLTFHNEEQDIFLALR